MRKEADLHADEDKKKKELIEAKNIADTLVYTTEKALFDAGDKVPVADKKEIEEKAEELKKVKDGDNLEVIKQKSQELSQAAQKIGQAMYAQAQQAAGADQAGGEPKTDENKKPEEGEVVDGETEDKK